MTDNSDHNYYQRFTFSIPVGPRPTSKWWRLKSWWGGKVYDARYWLADKINPY